MGKPPWLGGYRTVERVGIVKVGGGDANDAEMAILGHLDIPIESLTIH